MLQGNVVNVMSLSSDGLGVTFCVVKLIGGFVKRIPIPTLIKLMKLFHYVQLEKGRIKQSKGFSIFSKGNCQKCIVPTNNNKIEFTYKFIDISTR